MKIAECSYCGMLAITDLDVCSSCASMLGIEPPAIETSVSGSQHSPVNQFQHSPQTNPASNKEEFPPSLPREENHYQPPPAMPQSQCLRCGETVPIGQSQCSDCLSGKRKKIPLTKPILIFSLLVVVIGFFGFGYISEKFSPWGIIWKYNQATHADNNVVYENFSLKGDVRVTAFNFLGDPKHLDEGLSPETMESQGIGEKFSFKMIFQKPNKSGVELFKAVDSEDSLIFKQVYDGVLGWQYSNMRGQPAGYQTKQDGFGIKKFGFGLEDYDSAEFMNDAIKAEFGETNINFLSEKKNFQVNNDKKTSDSKIIVKVGKKVNGVMKYSILVFDQKSGLLIGMALKEAVNNLPVVTTFFIDRYKEFSVKRQGWLGINDQIILVPTRVTLVIGPDKSNSASLASSLMMDFNVTGLDIDTQVPENYFVQP